MLCESIKIWKTVPLWKQTKNFQRKFVIQTKRQTKRKTFVELCIVFFFLMESDRCQLLHLFAKKKIAWWIVSSSFASSFLLRHIKFKQRENKVNSVLFLAVNDLAIVEKLKNAWISVLLSSLWIVLFFFRSCGWYFRIDFLMVQPSHCDCLLKQKWITNTDTPTFCYWAMYACVCVCVWLCAW